MTTTMNWPRCFPHPHPESTGFINRIGILGAGNVVKTKIIPALEANSHLLEDVIVGFAQKVAFRPYRKVEGKFLQQLSDFLGKAITR